MLQIGEHELTWSPRHPPSPLASSIWFAVWVVAQDRHVSLVCPFTASVKLPAIYVVMRSGPAAVANIRLSAAPLYPVQAVDSTCRRYQQYKMHAAQLRFRICAYCSVAAHHMHSPYVSSVAWPSVLTASDLRQVNQPAILAANANVTEAKLPAPEYFDTIGGIFLCLTKGRGGQVLVYLNMALGETKVSKRLVKVRTVVVRLIACLLAVRTRPGRSKEVSAPDSCAVDCAPD